MMTVRDYIKKRLLEVNLSVSSLTSKNEYKLFVENTGSTCNYHSYKRRLYEGFEEVKEGIEQDEVISDNLVKLQANKQALQDKNNVERKITRESNRLYNHLSELYQGYIDIMTKEKLDLNKFKLKSEKIQDNSGWGILQLSDLHLNKLIRSCENLDNEYDFNIASKRLKKFITEAIFYFKAKNIKNIYVAMTGDLLTSDRRESEKLNRVTNQIKASLLASYILKQALIELNQYFGIWVGCVVGNESRLNDDMYSDEIMATNNYDFLLFNNLRLWLSDTNIKFDMSGNFVKKVITLDNAFTFVLFHGHTLKTRDLGKEIKNVMTEFALKGIKINCILCGHYHSACCGDIFSRSSSLSGTDPYPNSVWLFDGRPSQNIYIINNDNSYNSIKIDLADTSDIIGYNIKEELATYYVDNIMKPNTEIIIRNFI